MLGYQVFIDRYGVLKHDTEYEAVKKVYDFAIDEKRKGVGKFKDKNIYLLKMTPPLEEEAAPFKIMEQSTREAREFAFGGDVALVSIDRSMLSRFINGASMEIRAEKNLDVKFDSGAGRSFHVKVGNVFVKCIQRMNGFFMIYSQAISDSAVMASIEDLMKKLSADYKII
jgi:hypothetical protein